MNPRDYNLEDLEEDEYNKFEVEGCDNIPEMALNNSIDTSTGMGTYSSTSRTPKIARSTI